ncbi:tyrosine-type recombinase/integrase [Microvirga calopogonii]|uniref:tyrosine-type recombinase/integrase n=1 Tax=Microvirga calopogonii TaxID=2078013 RepID=UPI000E0DC261|nr:site-specific integrase [Microvirga calopogonii]
MNSLNPFPAPTRTGKTADEYLKEGERHLRKAGKKFPLIACPAKALVAIRKNNQVLKASTARRYWQEHLAILGKLRQVGQISGETHDEAKAAIKAALFDNRKRPGIPRTGAKKVRDLSEAEAASLIEALVQKVQGSKADDVDRYLLLYVRLAPVLGFRPCEGVGIRLFGPTLLLPCAKNTNGRAGRDTRPVNLKTHEAAVLDLIAEFITVQQALIDTYGSFDGFYPAARQRLGRLSVRVVQRRVCPYSFRHVAMATWKAAGYDVATIALLAGHSSKVTAGKHYAGKSKGWKADFALVAPADVSAVTADETAVPTNMEDLVKATTATEADAPTSTGLNATSEPENEADEEAGKFTTWEAFLEFSSLPVPSRKPAGNALWDRRRDRTHPVACEYPTIPYPDFDSVSIPTHADLVEPDAVDESEEDAGLGMRF